MLNLEDNHLSSLPEGIFSESGGLTRLWLSDNKLSELRTDVFSGLTALRSLRLGRNELLDLPAGVFSGLGELRALNLDRNNLSSLPKDLLAGLASLESLTLSGNELTDLPARVFADLRALRQLNLSDNSLPRLRADMFYGLDSLLELSFYENWLTDLPARVFDDLQTLEWLRLGSNDLRNLPDGIFSRLTGLRSLALYDNELTELSPDVFSGLHQLEYLNLDSNEIMELPASLFSDLTSLEDLFLGGNQLTELPDGLFSGLARLSRLQLHDNARDPLLLPVSIEKAGDSQFRATAPAGAPFDLDISVGVNAAGAIEGNASAVIIPAGALASTTLGVMRSAGTEAAVTVDIHELPELPNDHEGYILQADRSLPRLIIPGTGLQAPSQVTGLEVLPGVEQLEVAWNEVAGANGYKVQWKSGDQDYDEARQAVLTGGDMVSYTIMDLTPGTQYTVRVIATKEQADDGEPSAEVTGIPKAAAPAQVTGVVVEPGLEELAVSWDAVSDADGYKVQWKSGTQDYDEARQGIVSGGDTVSHTITDLTADTEYILRVIATREHADDGEPSGEVTATPLSANPDVNGDGTLDGNDALIMYHSYASEDRVGDGETGGTVESRQSLLAGYSGKDNPTDDELKEMIRKSLAWQEVGVEAGGDINEDGEIDEEDAYVMYHAYANANLVGNGTTGGTARFRQLLLVAFAGKENPTDEDLKAMLRRANKLREDFD